MSVQIISTQISIFSIIILLVIYVTNLRKNATKLTANCLYHLVIWATIVVLASDVLTLLVNGKTGSLFYFLHVFGIIIYYFSHILIVFLWMLYVSYHIEGSSKRFKRIFLIFTPVLIITLVVLIFNINRNIVFEIDANNIYSRGKYLLAIPLFNYITLAYIFIFVFLNKSKLNYQDYHALLFYPLPPAVAGVLQLLFPGVTLIWPFTTLSLLIVYMYIQSRISTTDYLTGLYNRREFDLYIKRKIVNIKHSNQLGGILIDINNFKNINDEFLHQTGDMVLIEFANLLRKSVDKKDFIARIGGDEFIILFETADNSKLDRVIDRIKNEILKFNEKSKHQFNLDISYGACYLDKNKHKSTKEYFSELDKKMYKMKKE